MLVQFHTRLVQTKEYRVKSQKDAQQIGMDIIEESTANSEGIPEQNELPEDTFCDDGIDR